MLTCVVAIVMAGCTTHTAPPPDVASPATRQLKRDHFELAFEFLHQRDRHNPDRAARQATYHLNKWIEEQSADPHWMIDRRLINTLPAILRSSPAGTERLSDKALAILQFNMGDIWFLEEARWLQATARWASQKEPSPTMAAWLKTFDPPPQTAKQLGVCDQLFDWTVRNVQLDPLLPYPKQAIVGPQSTADAKDPTIDWPPPLRGIPGPGYQHYPWQVLLYGHGDMLERARVFMLLARQLHMDAVILGIATKTGRPRPWLPAVLLDGQLYLFDTTLGLPIPGPNGRPVATLTEVLQDPSLLDQLRVGKKYPYRVSAPDLKKVVALIGASHESMSQRMKILETHLDAANRMVLSVSPTRLKKELDQCKGVSAVRLWAVPFETAMYQQVLTMLTERNEQLQLRQFMDHGIMNGLTLVGRGRRQNLLTHFDKQDDLPGAKKFYLDSRTPNAQIEAIDKSKQTRAMVGLQRPPQMSEREWNAYLQREKFLRIQSKQNASYWLGLVHLEEGNYPVAANWFKKRTLDAWPEGRWTSGAQYNLARCYEAMHQLKKARQLYLIDESPQRHGNLLRARRLEKEIQQANKVKAEDDTTKEPTK